MSKASLMFMTSFSSFLFKLFLLTHFFTAFHALYRWLYFASQKIVVINQLTVFTVLTSLVVLRKVKFASSVTKHFLV